MVNYPVAGNQLGVTGGLKDVRMRGRVVGWACSSVMVGLAACGGGQAATPVDTAGAATLPHLEVTTTSTTQDIAPTTTAAPAGNGTLPHMPGTIAVSLPSTTGGSPLPPLPPVAAPAPPSTVLVSDADRAERTCASVLAESVHGDTAPGENFARIEPMLGQLVAYGQMHPEVFGGYGLVWHGPDDPSAFVGITHDVASHRAALERGVDHPDDLVVCRSPLNQADQAQLVEHLQSVLPDIGMTWGTPGPIGLNLGPEREQQAQELYDRYGELVEITVGRFRYPMPEPLPAAVCPELPAASTLEGLAISVDLPPGPVPLVPDHEAFLTVRFRNTGDEPIALSFGQPTALLLDPASGRIVAAFSGLVAGALDVLTLAPGEEGARSLLATAAACDPADGYRLAPGTYDLVGVIDRGGITDPPLVTPSVTIELTW
jgi:hypothetical protein